jgi:Tfp pilus assembly protein PilN
MIKKNLVIVVLATFCLTATLFLIRPSNSQTGTSDETTLLLELQFRLDSLNSSIQALQAQLVTTHTSEVVMNVDVGELKIKVAALESEVASLQSRVNTLESGGPQKGSTSTSSIELFYDAIRTWWSWLLPNSTATPKS